jgi:hypothetical protein
MSDGSLDGFAAVFESCFDQVYGYVAYRLAPDLDASNTRPAARSVLVLV